MSSTTETVEDVHVGGQEAPMLSGANGELGHLEELREKPTALMQRVADELGEIGELDFAGNRVVMLMGEAQERFFSCPRRAVGPG